MKKNRTPGIIIALSLIGCIWIIGKYFTVFKGDYSNSQGDWGTFGDYIGGVVGTVFGLLSVYLLYHTLNEQRKTSEAQRFETKYYTMMQLHRDNVKEIGIGDDFGKKIFVILIREFRKTLEVVKLVNEKVGGTIERETLLDIAYVAFFFGTGPNSTRVLINMLSHYDKHFIEEICTSLDFKKEQVKLQRNFKHIPFEGHQSRLAQYFRHLYQTISFIDQYQEITEEEKKRYIKTIRAQLSNHEQALLFFNSLSSIGYPWRYDGLITKYALIKNLPKSFIDEVDEIDVKSIYPSIVFEWEEAYVIRQSRQLKQPER